MSGCGYSFTLSFTGKRAIPHSRDVIRPAGNDRGASLHRAAIVELVLTVGDDRGGGLEGKLALGAPHHFPQIEILGRGGVFAVLERAAHPRANRPSPLLAP